MFPLHLGECTSPQILDFCLYVAPLCLCVSFFHEAVSSLVLAALRRFFRMGVTLCYCRKRMQAYYRMASKGDVILSDRQNVQYLIPAERYKECLRHGIDNHYSGIEQSLSIKRSGDLFQGGTFGSRLWLFVHASAWVIVIMVLICYASGRLCGLLMYCQSVIGSWVYLLPCIPLIISPLLYTFYIVRQLKAVNLFDDKTVFAKFQKEEEGNGVDSESSCRCFLNDETRMTKFCRFLQCCWAKSVSGIKNMRLWCKGKGIRCRDCLRDYFWRLVRRKKGGE